MSRRNRFRAPRFRVTDVAQQTVGGFLLAGPFVVTEEVWDLAGSMNGIQAGLTALIVGVVGYTALYRADTDRDPDAESTVLGVPLRFVSLMAVSAGSVLALAVLFDAPDTFLIADGVSGAAVWTTTAKAVCVGAMFSVVGAATADSIF